ncbi:MAG: hypothetical protein GIS02_02375 [Methanosarcinales archaeon]|uniref:Uncharacterized protein n=1 Tax=Candidatus Ethanoperedens thermophilum TaxID=2766897 RepID=A0A848D9J5_9EURY|nr:hypothetical protein [Candidatus Ethanoperedens thermophilum]NMG83034.1 hypothetical protein [Candidatus Ethanoperedens thermophilum]
MTKVRKMNAKERFDLADEMAERICSDPDFDTFFMRYYNGKTLELGDDPIDEFNNHGKINNVYVKEHLVTAQK